MPDATAAGPAAPSDTPAGPRAAAPPPRTGALPLHAEALEVSRRTRRTLVRAARTTRQRDAVVEEDLLREEVCVRRVPVGRTVEAVPPVREEGDLVIVPVVEEVLVVERRLVLVEEIHLRRTRGTHRHTETVRLRSQDVVVTRTPLAD